MEVVLHQLIVMGSHTYCRLSHGVMTHYVEVKEMITDGPGEDNTLYVGNNVRISGAQVITSVNWLAISAG